MHKKSSLPIRQPKFQLVHLSKKELNNFLSIPGGHKRSLSSGTPEIDLDKHFTNHHLVNEMRKKSDHARVLEALTLSMDQLHQKHHENKDHEMAFMTPYTIQTLNYIMGRKHSKLHPETKRPMFSGGDKASQIVSGTLSGALGGGAIGGPIGAVVGGGLGLVTSIFRPSKKKREQQKQQQAALNAMGTKPEDVGLNPMQAGAKTVQNSFQSNQANTDDANAQNQGYAPGSSQSTAQTPNQVPSSIDSYQNKIAEPSAPAMRHGGRVGYAPGGNIVSNYLAPGALKLALKIPHFRKKIEQGIGRYIPPGPNNPVPADSPLRQDHKPVMQRGTTKKLKDGQWQDAYNPKEDHSERLPTLWAGMPKWLQDKAAKIHAERVATHHLHGNDPYKYANEDFGESKHARGTSDARTKEIADLREKLMRKRGLAVPKSLTELQPQKPLYEKFKHMGKDMAEERAMKKQMGYEGPLPRFSAPYHGLMEKSKIAEAAAAMQKKRQAGIPMSMSSGRQLP